MNMEVVLTAVKQLGEKSGQLDEERNYVNIIALELII